MVLRGILPVAVLVVAFLPGCLNTTVWIRVDNHTDQPQDVRLSIREGTDAESGWTEAIHLEPGASVHRDGPRALGYYDWVATVESTGLTCRVRQDVGRGDYGWNVILMNRSIGVSFRLDDTDALRDCESYGWTRDTCDLSPSSTVSTNAPPVPGFAGAPRDIARHITEAFGDEWVSDKPQDTFENFTRWTTRNGSISVNGDNGWRTYDYSSPHAGALTDTRIRSALSALGVDLATVETPPPGSFSGGALQQVWRGQRVARADWLPGHGDPAPYGQWGSVTLDVFHDLGNAHAALPGPELQSIAARVAACAASRFGIALPQGAATAGGFAVEHGSLVWLVTVAFGTNPDLCAEDAEALVVHLDAVTAAVHGIYPRGGCE